MLRWFIEQELPVLSSALMFGKLRLPRFFIFESPELQVLNVMPQRIEADRLEVSPSLATPRVKRASWSIIIKWMSMHSVLFWNLPP